MRAALLQACRETVHTYRLMKNPRRTVAALLQACGETVGLSPGGLG